MITEGYDVYQYYCALKAHFSSESFNILKHSKTRANRKSFEKRNDKLFFRRIGKNKDWKNILLANAVRSKNIWIGDIESSEAMRVYLEWLKIKQSLSYHFKNDLEKLDDDLMSNFKVPSGETYPKIVQLYLHGDILLETLCILENFWNWTGHSKIDDPYIWPDILMKINKYRAFVRYDKTAYRNFIKMRFGV